MNKVFDKNSDQSVWQNKGRYYLCSTGVGTRFPEVMVFNCDSKGMVTDWGEIYVGYADVTNHAHHMEMLSKVDDIDSFHLKTF